MFDSLLRKVRHTGARILPVPSPDQDRDLVLYKFDACPYCQYVLGEARTLGLDLPQRDTRREPAAAEALRAATGRTQVPCLFIDGVPLLESRDIVEWLRKYVDRA